jgi:tRNA threonylcarbamoyladenosine biosynthesis protein TsaB
MKILSLSTAEQGCSLAVTDGTSLLYEEYWTTKETHSVRLLKMISHAVENRVNMNLKDIELFIVANGPGSFTGLRIGISTSSVPVFAMMDARRGEVYCALYHFNKGYLISKSPEQVLKPVDAVNIIKGKAVLFAGTGAKVYQDIILDKAEEPFFSYELNDFVSAQALVQAFYWGGNVVPNFKTPMIPNYIRKSDAEINKLITT